MNVEQDIQKFLAASAFAVVGVSNNRAKYGNKVLRAYLQNNKKAYPVHPTEKMIEGVPCVATISDLPEEVKSLSIITPPPLTEKIVEQAIAKGIKYIWMQPGAESPAAVENCRKHGVTVIADGSCALVAMHFHEHA